MVLSLTIALLAAPLALGIENLSQEQIQEIIQKFAAKEADLWRTGLASYGQTGERIDNFSIPEELALPEHDWGYVSRIESQLYGSAVRRGSQYLGDKGEWYEKLDDNHTAKVTSDAFFSINAYSGETDWTYSDGQIINSTITIANGRVFFIESRSGAAREAVPVRRRAGVHLRLRQVRDDAAGLLARRPPRHHGLPRGDLLPAPRPSESASLAG